VLTKLSGIISVDFDVIFQLLIKYIAFVGYWGEKWEYNRTVKVKVKLSLLLTKHNAMKTYWGSGCIAPRILDLGTRWR
jgi:hypothetical protein